MEDKEKTPKKEKAHKKNVMSLKLLIDFKTNKVLFAEASKSFVDFLFYLLSLPIGTVINLLNSKYMAGSIGNLYKSFSDLDKTYLQPNLQKNTLLNPMPSTPIANVPLLMGSSTSDNSMKFYDCSGNCNSGVTDRSNSVACPKCKKKMTREVPFLMSFNTTNACDGDGGEGYVKGVVSYMISDDLSVTPMSMISGISMMNKFKVSQFEVLQEMEVQVGTKEALELLKFSFQSTCVLTDVFLPKKKGSVRT